MKGTTCIIAKLHRTDLVNCSHSREGKPPSYSRINNGRCLRLFGLGKPCYTIKQIHVWYFLLEVLLASG